MFYFCTMVETNRQKKIAGVLQNDLANVLQSMLREAGQMSIIISVSKVTVTTDLSISKVYVSVFPADKAEAIVAELNKNKPNIRLRNLQNISFARCPIFLFIMMILWNTLKGLTKP